MHVKYLTALAAVAVALGACAPKNPQPPQPQAGSARAQADGVIPQAQLDALNKAKNVENVILQGEQRRREQGDAAQ